MGVTASRKWTIISDLDAIPAVAEAIRKLSEASVGAEGADAVEIAVVEALTNLVKHGYPDEPGRIEIAVRGETGGVTVDIFDTGQTIPDDILARAGTERFAFDPEDIDGLVEGGMGLSIIFMTMDVVDYSPQAGRNWLHLVRHKRN